jgi:hypothetical protein
MVILHRECKKERLGIEMGKKSRRRGWSLIWDSVRLRIETGA